MPDGFSFAEGQGGQGGDLEPYIQEASQRFDIDPRLIRSMVHTESGGNPMAVSDQGAMGPMQTLPDTYAEMARKHGLGDDVFDPHDNIMAGTAYLRENYDRFRDPSMAIMAYHGGPDTRRWGPKTQQYLDLVAQGYTSQPPEPEPAPKPAPAAPKGFSFEEASQPAAKPFSFDEGRLPMAKRDVPSQPSQPAQAAAQPAQPVPPNQPDWQDPAMQEREARASRGWQAASDAFHIHVLEPAAQQWADAHGLHRGSQELDAVVGAFNAAWAGAMETANQIGEELGFPTLGRDAAAYLESAGMTGAPHIPPLAEPVPRYTISLNPEATGRAAPAGLPPAAEAVPGGVGESTAEPPTPEPAVAQPQTFEQASLNELDPETEAAAEKHHGDLAEIAKEEGVQVPPWTKPGLREREQYGPPQPPPEMAPVKLPQAVRDARDKLGLPNPPLPPWTTPGLTEREQFGPAGTPRPWTAPTMREREQFGPPKPAAKPSTDESWVRDAGDVKDALDANPLPKGWEISPDPDGKGYAVYDEKDNKIGTAPTAVDALPVARKAAAERATPDYNALFDEAQALMKQLPSDMGKLKREGRVTPLQQQRMDRLDQIEQIMPTTGPDWQRIWNERRAAYDQKQAETAAQKAPQERERLAQAGFAEGDKVQLVGTSMLPNVPPPITHGTVRIRKDGTAYIAAEGKQYDPFASPWQKAPQATPGPSQATGPKAPPESSVTPPAAPQVQENIPDKGQNPDLLIADTIADRIASGRPLSAREVQAAGDHFFGGKLAEGAYGRDRLYDAQELGVNRFIQMHPERFDPRLNVRLAHAVVADLEQIKNNLPTQTVRAGEKDTHQQFSTPPDYAYAAAWAANLQPGDHVLEPSAGIGGLAVYAKNAGATVTANEISDKRAGMLQHLGMDQITREDARQIHNALPASIKPSVVLMNPPFSAAPGRMANKMILGEGASHIKAALDRLEPGGRLVAIVGRGMTMDAPAFRNWWKGIGNQYDVRANVGVGGKVYQKYGTNFGTRLLVIDKITPSRQPIIGGEVEHASDLIDKLEGIRDDRPVKPMAGQPSGAPLAPSGEGQLPGGRELPGTTGVVGAGERPAGTLPAEQPRPAPPRRGGTGARPTPPRGGEGGGGGEPVVPGEPEHEPAGTGERPPRPIGPSEIPTPSGPTGGGDGVRADGSGQLDEPGVTPTPEIVVKSEQAVTDPNDTGLTEAVYEPYTPQRLKIPGAQPHPGALVQSAAMASVMPPEPKYTPHLPKDLVTSGRLSIAQLEAVVYAGQAHNEMLASGERRGFFIGDGTGVGKGREIAGIIQDSMAQGRQKHVWISESKDLINDAKRDWTGLGNDAAQIFHLAKTKPADPVKATKGIMFTTYATLRGGEKIRGEAPKPGEEDQTPKYSKGKTRVDQIADWFGPKYDGVIVFDEAHNLGNAMNVKGKRGVKEASQMALAGLELQQKLPNARVVYVSATGATEVSNLAYAERLGLWGPGTAFPNRGDFLSKVSSGGVAAMELVARDMKALGHYTARNLSYDGVEYDRLQHNLTPDQRDIYDKLAEGWQLVLRHFEAALAVTSADDTGKVDPKAKSAALSAFWGGHQRFFNQIITSMQMPSVLKAVEQDLKEGRQAVLQLVNTNEASMGRALEKANPEELEDLDMTPRDQLMQMVEKSYPTQQMEPYADDEGNIRMRPVVDSHGNPVHNKEALAARDRLLDQLGSIRVPDGPLEILLNHFGTDKVAEVTGRKQRVVRKRDDDGVMKTVVEKRPGDSNVVESKAFQDGKKPILVFSNAGSTGRSFHADNTVPSASKRRSHYLVQPGWQAARATQGFGRSHRTNQASAPIFHLVTTDLQGQRRFISSIARRLGQLGALTKGERRTGDQGLFGMKDNLESELAQKSLHGLFREIMRGEVEGLTADDLEKGMGLKLRDSNGQMLSELPPIPQFLNRLLSLKIEDQNRVFNEFDQRHDEAIQRAAAAGTLDTGVETYKADKIVKKGDQVVYTDPASGAETRHVHLEVHTKTNPTSFDEMGKIHAVSRRLGEDLSFVQNNRSGRIYARQEAGNYTNEKGEIIPQYKLTGPNSYQYVDRHRVDFGEDNWRAIEQHSEARKIWDKEVAATPPYAQSDMHLITGAVLPIWDRLGGSPKVYRLQTDDGEKMLGRVVPNKLINQTLDRLGAEKQQLKVKPEDVVQRILGGDTARLANDWTINPRTVAGERRLELTGPSFQYDRELEAAGVFKERIGYQTRYFIPTGERAAAVIKAITERRPIVQLGEDYAGEGQSLYSFPGALFDPSAWRRAFGNNAPQAPNEMLADKEGPARGLAEVKAGLAPTSLRGAKPMEYAIRAHTSALARQLDIHADRLEQAQNAVGKLSQAEQIDSADRYETGQPQHDPVIQRAADLLRRQTDDVTRRIQALGKGQLANAIENYMGHIWGNYREWSQGGTPQPQSAMQARAMAGNARRQPLQGTGNFLKQRVFPTQLEGINAGLIPVSYNWITTGLIKLHEMEKWYHGAVLADRLKTTGLAHFVRDSDAGDALSAGQVPLDDKIFQPKLYGVTPIGPVEPGKWYAPEPAARIFNNYMSQGWNGRSAIYSALRQSNNALNQLQLGFGAFHAAFVTNDVAVSKVALGLQQIANGELGRGAGNMLFGIPLAGHGAAVWDSWRKGARVQEAWLHPNNVSPEMQPIINAIMQSGYIKKMHPFFNVSNQGPLIKHLSDLKDPAGIWHEVTQMFRDAPTYFQKAIMTPMRLAGRVIQTTMEPLMGTLVPRMKAGVLYDLAADYLRRNPTATPRELAENMTKFQDTVDNRLGQLNYDNLFWHRTLKDIAFVTTRSVGWNLGTIREIGGGFVDAAGAIKGIASGRAPQLTTRMAYTLAMPIVTAMVGAVLTYLATGRGPQHDQNDVAGAVPLDYFYPPTGTLTEQGVPDRRSIPGYMKDVIAFAHAPVQTMLNKTAPMLEAITELARNKNYYGGVIYDPERMSGPAQAYGNYLLNQTLPFSARSMMRSHAEGEPALDQALGFFGFQQAPASITNPERTAKFQRKEDTKAYRTYEKQVGKGLTVEVFPTRTGAPP